MEVSRNRISDNEKIVVDLENFKYKSKTIRNDNDSNNFNLEISKNNSDKENDSFKDYV